MPDVHDKQTRSYNMSKIKGKDTKPEIIVRKYLFSKGFRFRVNDKRYPGNPDIVLPKYKTCIFVNGCFWHIHEDCKYFVWPKNNMEFWHRKLTANKERDSLNYRTLCDWGWNVVIVWECELRKEYRADTLEHLVKKYIATRHHNNTINCCSGSNIGIYKKERERIHWKPQWIRSRFSCLKSVQNPTFFLAFITEQANKGKGITHLI